MVAANAQNMSALAQLHAAVHGKPDADERLVKGMMKTRFEELLAADRAAERKRTDGLLAQLWMNTSILLMESIMPVSTDPSLGYKR